MSVTHNELECQFMVVTLSNPNKTNCCYKGCDMCFTPSNMKKTNYPYRGCNMCITPTNPNKDNYWYEGCGMCPTPSNLNKTNYSYTRCGICLTSSNLSKSNYSYTRCGICIMPSSPQTRTKLIIIIVGVACASPLKPKHFFFFIHDQTNCITPLIMILKFWACGLKRGTCLTFVNKSRFLSTSGF